MSRTRRTYVSPQGPFPCELCAATLTTKNDRRAIEGWEWFCGYGDRPAHFCPRCSDTKHRLVELVRAKLNERPDNYDRDHMLSTTEIITKLFHEQIER